MFQLNQSEEILLVKDTLLEAMDKALPPNLRTEDVFFVCVGTDRSTGDSLGPIIGTMLEDMGFTNVLGTIDDPVHGTNLEEQIQRIPVNKVVIAIDAALGQASHIGDVVIQDSPLRPGAALRKNLPSVGEYCIKGIVNTAGFMEAVVLQNTRLKTVKRLACIISSALAERFPVREEIHHEN